MDGKSARIHDPLTRSVISTPLLVSVNRQQGSPNRQERRPGSMALPTVLIVEDDVDLRQTLAESLEASGFAAAQAVDATDAIDRLKHFAYDAMVIDLHLPDAN